MVQVLNNWRADRHLTVLGSRPSKLETSSLSPHLKMYSNLTNQLNDPTGVHLGSKVYKKSAAALRALQSP